MLSESVPKNLHCIPYIRGIPEYAIEVRKKVKDLKNQNFVVAVDLPHSLEEEVLKAVKRLPRISLIVDPLNRAIPIIPSCASIEAVRSYLEFGTALQFIDTSLPITGKMKEWKRFISLYQKFGAKEVISKAEGYGIDLPKLFHSGNTYGKKQQSYFYHLPGRIGSINYSNLQSPLISAYIDARQRYMAMRLNELLKEDKEILFICAISHFKNVLKYLHEPEESFDDTFYVPTVICNVKEEDVVKISPEVPYFMYQYDIFRDNEVAREKWMLDLYSDEGRENSVDIKETIDYSMKLALTDGQLYPDLYNIVSASLFCGDNTYARRILKRARSYPGADRESNCTISTYFDYDFNPLKSQRILIIPSEEESHLPHGITSAPRLHRKRSGIKYFERTHESKHHELEFMNYLKSRYLDLKPSEEYETEEFHCGLKDGFEPRITTRYQHLDKIFVKQNKVTNGAVYVVNFGGVPDWRVFFDTNYVLVGSAKKNPDNKNTWVCFTTFSDPPESAENLLEYIDLSQPLLSCMDLALAFSKNVYLFTDRFDERAYYGTKQKNIKVFSLSKIPRKLRETMRCFDVKK